MKKNSRMIQINTVIAHHKITVILSVTIMLIVQGCAGSGGLAGNGSSKEYNQDYERMKQVVEQAIRASNMNISFVNDEGNKMTLIVGRDRYVGSEQVQQEQGEIRLLKKDDETTVVEVKNPDYHFSVPSHQKEDYQRIIFLRIDDILKR